MALNKINNNNNNNNNHINYNYKYSTLFLLANLKLQ